MLGGQWKCLDWPESRAKESKLTSQLKWTKIDGEKLKKNDFLKEVEEK